ncbi:MAG: VanW family protein [Clostridiales bacterium]|jgi:vancomycin resistance protein YoaR|nr:VanW family protein [Clostridiales bacterium]
MIDNFSAKIKSFWSFMTEKPTRIALTGAIIMLLGISITAVVLASNFAQSSVIHKNVYVGATNLSGKNLQEAEELLRNTYMAALNDKSLQVEYGGVKKDITMSMIDAQIDYAKTAEIAYNIGRSGNFIRDLSDYTYLSIMPKSVAFYITFSYGAMNDNIQDFANNLDGANSVFKIEGETLSFNKSALTQIVDIEATTSSVVRNMCQLNFANVAPTFASSTDNSKLAKLIHARLACTPLDASISSENGYVVYLPGKNGIEFTTDDLAKALATPDDAVSMQVKVIPPSVTVEKLKAELFRDVMGEMTTRYNAGEVGRTQNLKQGAAKINNTIIMPGREFSFNGTVGERTVGNGFSTGHVFQNGQVVDGIGGGICQVSSTLYNAVLRSDLQVVSRHNHMFGVVYVPWGQDATVSYGSLDFVFKNNTQTPIKIVTSIGGGSLTIKILGTKTDIAKTVEIYNQRIATTPFPTTTQPNPNTNAKKDIVSQNGQVGATVDSYKIVKRDGNVISRTFLHRSVYQPMPKIVLTPMAAPATTPAPAPADPVIPTEPINPPSPAPTVTE